MMNSFSRNASFNRRGLAGTISSPRAARKAWIFRPIHAFILFGAIITFLSAIGGGYVYVLPNLTQAFHGFNISTSSYDACNVFDGRWVEDDRYPLYNASECPFVERGFNCLGNGRADTDYLRWRWKPDKCEIPFLDVQSALVKLRDKRVVFVGDSMSRTQWESLTCLLMSGVEDKTSVYEVNGNKITKRIRFLGVRFSSFNFTVEFYRSVYLVQHGWTPKHAPKRVRSALKLDELDSISSEWVDSDVLIFNSGQWWVPGKLFDTGCYFQVGGSLKLGLSIPGAFRTALDTWASWVNSNINANRTTVFFRTFEPSHWRDNNFRFCNVTKYPISETEGRDRSIFTDTILEVAKNMVVPVNVLQITSMSAFRKDAHVGYWSDSPSVPDCSHWCLPGVPDIWNEIVLSNVFTTNTYQT
uniref:Trichome birefringence-like N-terminal domain-containing protein n=1 Tax=Kalanchoe fedtschenkoi TaxID=63787 RepID=A0A7N0T8S6_KALFE